MIDLNLTMIIQLFIVLSLVVILSQIVFKPFLGILQERKDRVKRAEEQARDLQHRSEELMERYRGSIAAAHAQGATIREKIRKESLAKEMEILQRAMEEANRLIQEIKMRIRDEMETARAGLQSQAQNLSREIAERILGRGLQ
jgi:F0F1-type ATP synthase membrane subunit b/b'